MLVPNNAIHSPGVKRVGGDDFSCHFIDRSHQAANLLGDVVHVEDRREGVQANGLSQWLNHIIFKIANRNRNKNKRQGEDAEDK